jgi:hypothetical protein
MTTSGRWVRALAVVTSCLLAACTHPTRVTAFTQGPRGGPPITRIAVAPAVSSIDRLIAGALRQEGCAVHDPTETAGILAAHHLDVGLLEKPEGLAALASEGVDALLIAAPDYPGWVLHSDPKYGINVDAYKPRRVTVRLVRTVTGEAATAFVWENARCGMRGSPCDQRAQYSASFAAGRVADLVLESIGSTPGHVIETAGDDGTLVISGVAFKKKKSRCSGFTAGRRVRFTVGDPRGQCERAWVVLIQTGELCDLRCPQQPE